jgi:transcriptional regulator with XRE-family HTH domain
VAGPDSAEGNSMMHEGRSEQFGRYFAQLRRERTGLSLRQFCKRHGFDPGNISKLERGKLPPPQSREKLEQYARALGLEEGSEQWYELFDRAATARGRLPEELLDKEEVVAKLPLLFRTLRGDRVDDQELERLMEILRRA